MTRTALLLFLFACTDEPGTSECTVDSDCLDIYSVELPFCSAGYCVECTDNDHCESGQRCYDNVCDVANCNTADCR